MSEVWNHFFMASNGLSVTCNHCGKFMKRSDSSTKSMWGHLKAFHADLVGEETFRLKRTRRMRGEGGGGGSSKTKMATKAKGGEGKSVTNGPKGRKKTNSVDEAALTSNSSGGSSFSSASSSSGGEELDDLEEPVECSSRASSNNEVGEQTDTKNGEAEEAKEAEEQCRKGIATPPMANGVAEATAPPTEVQKTPTQPYVKRKRPHQKDRQPSEEAADDSPLSIPLITAFSQQSAADQQLLQSGAAFVMPSSSPAVPSFGCAVPSTTHGNAIPCSASSAFSKYSTAALLMDNSSAGGGCSVGTASPSHASEAPKQFSRTVGTLHLQQQQQSHPLPAPRPKYGLEALSGMDTTPLAMAAGVADPAMLANLEAAATMNRLLNEYQYQQQKNNPNTVQQHPQNVQQKLAHNGNGPQPQQHISAQQLNELLALYAASALQQQQQKSADPQQQQLAAQQAAAAVSWLYNWEWMAAAAAAAAGKQPTQQKPMNDLNNLLAGSTTPSKIGNGTQQQNMNERKTAVASSNINNNHSMNMLMSAGIPLLSALSLGGKVPGIGAGNNGTATAMAEVAHPSKNATSNNNNAETKQNQQQQATPNSKQQTQKRKSPAEERDCAASLLALADTAAAEQRQREGASPPKNRRMGEQCEKQQHHDYQNNEGNTANGLADGASEALAESLVLYGMHRIAMELQLSYYVHGNKAGRAEYAFYCSNTEGNANIQRKVTLTESADQLLLIREYANGAVVAEECWPKNSEPGTLLLSLRDKCQRRLCA